MPFALKAQHTTTHTSMLWEGYYNTMVLSKNCSLISDVQLRTSGLARQWSQFGGRSGVNYKLNKQVSVTAGFAFYKNAQYSGKELFLKNEWRPWQELSYQIAFRKLNFIQRLRTEQRFMQQVVDDRKTHHYQTIFRTRYRFEFQLPTKKNKIVFLAGNEVLVNPCYLNNRLFFDQNRAFGGATLKCTENTGLQFQYVKILQWHSITSTLDNQDVIRINFLHQFNFRNKYVSKQNH